MPEDEAELTVAAQRGDLEAFARLMDVHLRPLRAFVALRAPVPHLIDEVVHEAFVHAYRRLADFRPGSDLGAWLRAIAHHQLRREVQRFARERGNRQRYAEHLVLAAAADAAGPAPGAELERLRGCLERLPAHLRDLVDLKYREDRSSEEIAGRLSRSVAWVRTTLFRVRAQLRTCIEAGAP